MDPRRAVVLLGLLLLLLLLTDWGQAEGPGDLDGDQDLAEDGGPGPARDTQPPRALLHTLLQAMERPGRSPAFLFQPQRFGRNAQGPWSKQRLSPRAGEGLSSQFWSLAAPQRFGKK